MRPASAERGNPVNPLARRRVNYTFKIMAKKQATKDCALKIGDLIQGKPIIDIEQRASGARQRGCLYAILECDCKTRFGFNLQMLGTARSGKMVVRCPDCQYKAKLAKSREGYFKIRPVVQLTEPLPAIALSAETLKRINKLTPQQRAKAEQLVRAHVRQCLLAGSPMEAADRIWTEAAEIAKKGDRLPETEWTRENRRDGLKIQRYDQYFGGIGAI